MVKKCIFTARAALSAVPRFIRNIRVVAEKGNHVMDTLGVWPPYSGDPGGEHGPIPDVSAPRAPVVVGRTHSHIGHEHVEFKGHRRPHKGQEEEEEK